MREAVWLVVLSVVAVLILFSSCGDNGNGPGDIVSEYFPLAIGNWWAFESDTLQSGDVRKDTISVLTRQVHSADSITYTIRHTVYAEGGTWQPEDTLDVRRWAERLVVRQVWTTVCADPMVERFICFLKQPLVTGDFWVSVGDTFVAGAACTLDASAETTYVLDSHAITVPAGEFKSATHIRDSLGWTLISTGTDSWWVEGIGRVMFAWVDSDEDTAYSRLVGYGVTQESR